MITKRRTYAVAIKLPLANQTMQRITKHTLKQLYYKNNDWFL